MNKGFNYVMSIVPKELDIEVQKKSDDHKKQFKSEKKRETLEKAELEKKLK